jgi:hypothetical protein
MDTFRKWTDAVRGLNEKIKRNRLIAGRNIQLEDTGCGIRINSSAVNSSGNSNYNGYFKVIQTADDKIKIVCGFDETRSYAGKVNVNYFPKTVAVVEFTITANSYIYLKCQLTGSPTAIGATAELVQSTDELESVKGTYYDLVSEVTFADEKITGFSRHNINKNILMAGVCT